MEKYGCFENKYCNFAFVYTESQFWEMTIGD